MRKPPVLPVLLGALVGLLLAVAGGALAFGLGTVGAGAGLAALETAPSAWVEGGLTAVTTLPGPPQSGIASEAGLTALGRFLGTVSEEGSSRIVDALQAEIKAQENLADASAEVRNSEIAKLYLSRHLARAARRATAEADQVSYGCLATENADLLLHTRRVGRLVGTSLRQGATKIDDDFRTSHGWLTYAASLDRRQRSPKSVLAPGGVLPPGSETATLAAISALTDPAPPPRVPSSLRRAMEKDPSDEPTSLVSYVARRNAFMAPIKLDQETLAHIARLEAGSRVPSLEDAWIRAVYRQAGEPPPRVVSTLSLLGAAVLARFPSVEWQAKIDADNPTGLLREIALAIGLEDDIAYQNLRLNLYRTGILASYDAAYMRSHYGRAVRRAYALALARR